MRQKIVCQAVGEKTSGKSILFRIPFLTLLSILAVSTLTTEGGARAWTFILVCVYANECPFFIFFLSGQSCVEKENDIFSSYEGFITKGFSFHPDYRLFREVVISDNGRLSANNKCLAEK